MSWCRSLYLARGPRFCCALNAGANCRLLGVKPAGVENPHFLRPIAAAYVTASGDGSTKKRGRPKKSEATALQSADLLVHQ